MRSIAICCVAAAAEIAAQETSPICIDPPPQSHNATLDAVVARALKSLAAPSLSWNVERAYRTGRGRGCRVGGRGIYHDHALCRRPRIGATA